VQNFVKLFEVNVPMKRICVLACFALFMFGGCKKDDSFVVNGIVSGASGQILYLEHTDVSSVTALDSIKLKADGGFSFKQKRTTYPELYRLRFNKQLIHFSVDSTETIIITADAHTFATSYTIEGSENSKSIKEISLAQLDAEHVIKTLRDANENKLIPDTVYEANFLDAIKHYKEIGWKYILGGASSPAAYFALLQQIDGKLIFDLYDRADSKAYGAVATSYELYYPESQRTQQLKQLALLSIQIIRGERKNQIDLSQAKEIYYIDVTLPDINDNKITLSQIAQNKAVLLNFTFYQQDWSPKFNMQLYEVYKKYKPGGFESYQVSLDNDFHFWKNVSANIPWITVRDPNSIYSSIVAIYNIKKLPALFLINKKGDVMKRIDSIETLDAEIKAAL
jgi:peroxiredoxin